MKGKDLNWAPHFKGTLLIILPPLPHISGSHIPVSPPLLVIIGYLSKCLSFCILRASLHPLIFHSYLSPVTFFNLCTFTLFSLLLHFKFLKLIYNFHYNFYIIFSYIDPIPQLLFIQYSVCKPLLSSLFGGISVASNNVVQTGKHCSIVH